MNHPAPTGGHRWDGSRYGHRTQRLLRLAPDTRTRALRAPQAKPCTACGNRVDWYPRHGAAPVPLHPHELPAHLVPEPLRWHVDQGVAHPYADGTAWCRVPHPPLCPSRADPPGHRLGRLEHVRRHLAVHTRRLIDTGRLVQQTPPAPPAAPTPRRDIVYLLHLLYLAPGPVRQTRCIAQTRQRTRCPHPLAASDRVPWATLPVPPAPRRDHLAAHLTDTPMLVRDLTVLPYADQLRWRHQHCDAHAHSAAPDTLLPEWEPFDAFAHHQHIRLSAAPEHPEPLGEWPSG